jgi:hypothetical protein
MEVRDVDCSMLPTLWGADSSVVIFRFWVDVLKSVTRLFYDVWGRRCLQSEIQTYRVMTASCILLVGYLTTLSMSRSCSVACRMINEGGAVDGTKIGRENERCNGLWMTKYICFEKCSCCRILYASRNYSKKELQSLYKYTHISLIIYTKQSSWFWVRLRVRCVDLPTVISLCRGCHFLIKRSFIRTF